MTALDQGRINTILSDSRFLAAFPELVAAKRKIAEISQKDFGGGCCGSSSGGPTDVTEALRPILSDLKRTIATWGKAQTDEFLSLMGTRALQITYRNLADSALVTVVIKR